MDETPQPDVQRGEPIRSGPGKSVRWSPLVDAVEAEPGEWFSMTNPLASRDNAYTAVYTEYAKRYLEVRTTGDRVFVRIRPNADTT